MAKSDCAVNHDHDYCLRMSQEEKDIEMVVESLLKSSSSQSTKVVTSPGNDLLCSSPTYSCDSGIDSFANDLVTSFGDGEGDEILSFLLDNDFSEIDFKNDKTEETKDSKIDKIRKGGDDLAKNKRNAENAKENRRKKKLYIGGLEKEVETLRKEKISWVGEKYKLEKKVDALQHEVNYVKSVLANQSMLSNLIKSVSQTAGVSLSTSLCSFRKPSLSDNEVSLMNKEGSLMDDKASSKVEQVELMDYQVDKDMSNGVLTRSSLKRKASTPAISPSPKRIEGSTGGVCLHVKERKVSLELCQHCSKMADNC